MASTAAKPGSIDFLHDFVQQCTASGHVSTLNGPPSGLMFENSETELAGMQRVPIMFRCVLPQINQSRHVLLLLRPDITCIEREDLINFVFGINNRINGTCGLIQRYRAVWANDHTPPAADIDTFNKILSVMGNKMNGIIEVDAVLLKCEDCDEMDRDKLVPIELDGFVKTVCARCLRADYELDTIS